jgi:hypothetical protein
MEILMSGRTYTKEEVVRRGREIYEREIRAKVEPEHDGEFVVVDVDSGSYEVSESDVEASDRALQKTPTPCCTFYGSDAPPLTGSAQALHRKPPEAASNSVVTARGLKARIRERVLRQAVPVC